VGNTDIITTFCISESLSDTDILDIPGTNFLAHFNKHNNPSSPNTMTLDNPLDCWRSPVSQTVITVTFFS